MIFPGRFAGKAMVVTGAAQGIGKMVALRAASEGARVLLVDRAPFVSEAAAEADGEAHGLVADLEDYAGAEAAMDKARTLLGGIDVLINNVGGAIRMRPYHAFEPGQIEAEIRRSLMPTLWCCHAAAGDAGAKGWDHCEYIVHRDLRHKACALFGGQGGD